MTEESLNSRVDVLVVGAGPAGLACAIALRQRGDSCVVVDRGSIADAIRRFPLNMTFFSTSELLEVGGVPFLSNGFRPTRFETVRYYHRVAQAHELDVRTGEEVLEIRPTEGAFRVATSRGIHHAGVVVVATGYFDSPSPFNIPGMELLKVHRTYTEPFPYVGREVAIVGGRNSAAEMALELFRFGARVTLIHRGTRLSGGVKYWLLPDIENRIKAGEIRALFETEVERILPESLVLKGRHSGMVRNDDLFVMIGYSPATALLERAGVRIDPETAIPEHDPASFETNVPGLYVAGSIAAGKFNNRIFIENGRLHGAVISGAIRKK